MTNVKDIGKELLGKTINSYHKKTGLKQIENNNEMQTKILQGIYSQVDNEYLEKTEEGNVIHLDGSGDGVVELESIEGNSLVNVYGKFNIYNPNNGIEITDSDIKITDYPNAHRQFYKRKSELPLIKPNTIYTIIASVKKNTLKGNFNLINSYSGFGGDLAKNPVTVNPGVTGVIVGKFTTVDTVDFEQRDRLGFIVSSDNSGELVMGNTWVILEGDYTNRPIPPYFEGLQSCFEEKKVGDKYEVCVEVVNKNLFIEEELMYGVGITGGTGVQAGYPSRASTDFIKVKENRVMSFKFFNTSMKMAPRQLFFFDINKGLISQDDHVNDRFEMEFTTPANCKYIRFTLKKTDGTDNSGTFYSKDIVFKSQFLIKYGNITNYYTPNKSNKIKLYINEPMCGLPNGVKDRLCIVDNKLMVERMLQQFKLTGDERYTIHKVFDTTTSYRLSTIECLRNSVISCDRFPSVTFNSIYNVDEIGISTHNTSDDLVYIKSNIVNDLDAFKTWTRNNNVSFIVQLKEPCYEEVTNEYGEPILLEGYENGTVYIDSIIPPTTTVKYTQKFASRNAVKELSNNNAVVMHDINDNIIPYMMDIDLMIMEKEMSVMNQKNIMKMGVLDMTSMQKRTQEMLERLFRGKTLTEQECKERVTTYLDAGKITDAQAVELMLVIAEVYQ